MLVRGGGGGGGGHGGGGFGGGGHGGFGGGGFSGGGRSFGGFSGSGGRSFASPSVAGGSRSFASPSSSQGARSFSQGNRSFNGGNFANGNRFNNGNFSYAHNQWHNGNWAWHNNGYWHNWGGWGWGWPWLLGYASWYPGYYSGYNYGPYYDYGYYDNGPYTTGYAPEQYPAAEQPTQPEEVQANGYLDQVLQAFQSGNYQDAMRMAEHAVVDSPKDVEMHAIISLSAMAQKDYRLAASEAHAVIALGGVPSWSQVYALYQNVDSYTNQLRALEEYVKAHPKSPEGQFLLGVQYMTTGYTAQVHDHLVQAAELCRRTRSRNN